MGAAGLVQRDALIAGSLGRAALASLARQMRMRILIAGECRHTTLARLLRRATAARPSTLPSLPHPPGDILIRAWMRISGCAAEGATEKRPAVRRRDEV